MPTRRTIFNMDGSTHFETFIRIQSTNEITSPCVTESGPFWLSVTFVPN